MSNNWMIRAGRGGTYIEDFETKGYAAIGWSRLGDLNQYPNTEAIRGFIGTLLDGDSGLFISTGGFSREAR